MPLAQVIIAGRHAPAPSHADVVSSPAAHIGRAHVVVAGSSPVSMQTELPELHTVIPVLQTFPPGRQAVPAVQAPHVPPLHTMFVPHDVPFGSSPPSPHTGWPVVQEIAPILQGLL